MKEGSRLVRMNVYVDEMEKMEATGQVFAERLFDKNKTAGSRLFFSVAFSNLQSVWAFPARPSVANEPWRTAGGSSSIITTLHPPLTSNPIADWNETSVLS